MDTEVPNTPESPQAKAAYRREEKRLLVQIAENADLLAQPGLDYAEVYLRRVHLWQTIGQLAVLRVES